MNKKPLVAGLLAFTLLQSCFKEEPIDENLAPSDFSVEAVSTTEQIALNWSEAIDPEGKTISYEVEQDGAIVALNLSTTTFVLLNLESDREYEITVTAIDADGMRTEVNKQIRTDIFLVPSEFQIEQSGNTVNTITISWNASTAEDNSEIVYDILLDDELLASDITDLEYTFEGLGGATWYTAKVLAKTRNDTALIRTLEVNTDGNTVVFGEANHPMGVPITEANYGIIEIPVDVRDLLNQNPSAALEEILFNFTIEGSVNERDYVLLTPSPLVIDKGATTGMIRISIIADEFQEFTNEALIVTPGIIQNAQYSSSPEPDTSISDPTFILDGRGDLLSDEVPDAYAVDISWSHPEAYISASLYQEKSGSFSRVALYDSGMHPQSFELATSRSDGNYYLEIERNDNVMEVVEVYIYVIAPDDPDTNFKTFTVIKNLLLDTSSTSKIVLDITIEGGVYSFTQRN